MLYYTLTIKEKDYKLRLDTRQTVELEKKLGCNPTAIFGDGETLPSVTQMVTILHYSLQKYHHGITMDDTYTIFDEYLEDGNTALDFVSVILELYKVSGLIKDNSPKNA